MTTSGVSSARAAATQAAAAKPPVRDADGDNDGSKAAAKIGPAVLMSLSNVAPDAASGDSDGDGK